MCNRRIWRIEYYKTRHLRICGIGLLPVLLIRKNFGKFYYYTLNNHSICSKRERRHGATTSIRPAARIPYLICSKNSCVTNSYPQQPTAERMTYIQSVSNTLYIMNRTVLFSVYKADDNSYGQDTIFCVSL